MVTLEEIKNCISYAQAIKLVLNKDYTNGSTIKKTKEWCLSNYNFDLEKHIEDYNNRKTYCLQCGKELTGENRLRKKFCDNSCAAKYNNKNRTVSEEQKQKVSNTLREKHAKENNETVTERYKDCGKPSGKKQKVKYKCICVTCGKEFLSTHKHSTHCSPKCTASDLNVKKKLQNKVQERINNGTFSGWQSRNITSYPEQFWIKVLNDHNITYVREDFSTKKYFLDFLIEKNGKKIDLEIDGKQHKDRKDHDKERDEYLTDLGYIVYRIDWNSINNQKGKDLMRSKINTFLNYYDKL